MSYKPLSVKKYQEYIKIAGWTLQKGKIDWNLYNENDIFICSIKIAHGKNTKEEVVAGCVKKTQRAFEERGLIWPPIKKKKN
jgi:hypothetical protein